VLNRQDENRKGSSLAKRDNITPVMARKGEAKGRVILHDPPLFESEK
jgi:hypothetical protein